MRKPYIVASLLCILISIPTLAAGGVLPGAGTEADPYLIEDVNDFDTFADPNNAAIYWAAGVHTKLTTNIDLSGRTYTTAVIAPDTNTGTGAYQGTPFSGNFNGNDFIVNHLKIDGSRYCGLFGKIETGSEVEDLRIENIFVTSTLAYAGGLAGYNDGSITNSYSTGLVNGRTVGGLVGMNWYGNITSCYSSGIVSGTTAIGGLVGENQNGSITNCYSTGTVIGDRWIGGLVGMCFSDITSSFSSGAVAGSYAIGGLAGEQTGGSIMNSYSTGAVRGNFAGGLVGTTWSSNITNCYSTGAVDPNDLTGGPIGGLIGENLITNVTDCFWDTDTSGQSTSAGGTGKTTAEMMMQSTFTGWDFVTPIWMMLRPGEDTPRLAWQEVFLGDIAGLYGVDMVDFVYLANYWGADCDSPACDRADVDTSGTIDLPDLAAVAEDWLK